MNDMVFSLFCLKESVYFSSMHMFKTYIVLTSLHYEDHCFSFCLEIKGTKNVVDYEALPHGIYNAKYYGINILHVSNCGLSQEL